MVPDRRDLGWIGIQIGQMAFPAGWIGAIAHFFGDRRIKDGLDPLTYALPNKKCIRQREITICKR